MQRLCNVCIGNDAYHAYGRFVNRPREPPSPYPIIPRTRFSTPTHVKSCRIVLSGIRFSSSGEQWYTCVRKK